MHFLQFAKYVVNIIAGLINGIISPDKVSW